MAFASDSANALARSVINIKTIVIAASHAVIQNALARDSDVLATDESTAQLD